MLDAPEERLLEFTQTGRGNDPPDAPWYDPGPVYGGKKGDRINDHHLTLAEKQAAREKKNSATRETN